MSKYSLNIVFGFIFLITEIECQSSDNYILSALGYQGDKLTDLESIIKTMQTQFNGLQTEMTSLKDENIQLKLKIEQMKQMCNKSVCCIQCNNGLNTGTTDIPTKYNTTQSLTTNYVHTNITTPIANVTHQTKTTNTQITTTMPFSSNYTTTLLQQVTSNVSNNAANQTTAISTTDMTTSSPLPANTTSTLLTSYSTAISYNLTTASQPITSTTVLPTTSTSGVTVYENCEDAVTNGKMGNSVVTIKLGFTGETVEVYCDAEGWLVIQRRVDGTQSFYQDWQTYRQGFGNLERNFWLGNENIYKLTSSRDYTLHIDFEDFARNTRYAEYEHFSIASEQSKYTLFAGSYTGDIGDCFHYRNSYMLTHYQMPFSTYDMDNDKSQENCAKQLKSGWWFNNCYSSDLNGPYLPTAYGHRLLGEIAGQPTLDGTGIEWYTYRKRQYSFKKVTMKIKPQNSAGLIG